MDAFQLGNILTRNMSDLDSVRLVFFTIRKLADSETFLFGICLTVRLGNSTTQKQSDSDGSETIRLGNRPTRLMSDRKLYDSDLSRFGNRFAWKLSDLETVLLG